MKVITVKQPWAWAIASGLKGFENRTWATRHRGPLAIHAGRQFDESSRPFFASLGLEIPDDLAMGAVVCVARLVDCHNYGGQRSLFDRETRRLIEDPWAFGPVCWELCDVRRLEAPIEVRGKLGLWTLPEGLMAA